MGVVAGADEGAAFDVAEAHGEGLVFEEGELVGGVVAGHGQVVAGGAEVLADGEDVDLAVGEVAEDAEELVHLLTHADDDAGFGHLGGDLLVRGGGLCGDGFGVGEEGEGAFVAAAGFGDAVEAGDGLDVVVEDLGSGGDDEAECGVVALEVRGEDFDAAGGGLAADLFDDRDEGVGGAEVVVVAVDGGDDGVGEAELGDGVGDAAGLVEVDGFGLALGDGAEAAAPGAEVAEHHEGGGLLVPALADVGAVGALADGVEVEVAGEFLEGVEGLAHGGFGLEPRGFGGGGAGGEVDLDEIGMGLDG